VYVTGYTFSSETTFPDGDPNANDQIDVPGFDRTSNGDYDGFLAKLGPTPTPTSTGTPTSTPTTTSTPIPTNTPVPTSTSTATPTPRFCAPRPAVRVATSPVGPGRLRVTLSAQTLPGTPTNSLRELRFGVDTNAGIDVPGVGTVGQGSVVPLAPGTAETTFFVRRQVPNAATTVSLVVVDACGEWPTFVGGGPTAF
jgi:hypothetical protein